MFTSSMEVCGSCSHWYDISMAISVSKIVSFFYKSPFYALFEPTSVKPYYSRSSSMEAQNQIFGRQTVNFHGERTFNFRESCSFSVKIISCASWKKLQFYGNVVFGFENFHERKKPLNKYGSKYEFTSSMGENDHTSVKIGDYVWSCDRPYCGSIVAVWRLNPSRNVPGAVWRGATTGRSVGTFLLQLMHASPTTLPTAWLL